MGYVIRWIVIKYKENHWKFLCRLPLENFAFFWLLVRKKNLERRNFRLSAMHLKGFLEYAKLHKRVFFILIWQNESHLVLFFKRDFYGPILVCSKWIIYKNCKSVYTFILFSQLHKKVIRKKIYVKFVLFVHDSLGTSYNESFRW